MKSSPRSFSHSRCSGILLHITSLPGPHGVGDFGPAAYQFADWLQASGQQLWQWLPTTPIGPGNSPYQSVSAFAGSPLMVALEPLLERGWLAAPPLPDGGFDPLRVNFERVLPWRLKQLRRASEGFAECATRAERQALADWALTQAGWLDDYLLFMALETAQGGQPWWHWPQALRDRDPAALADARRVHASEMAFWRFVQWCFDTQCAALKAHCHARGVSLMGDLPIFIAHHSADCWARPDLYFLDGNCQPTVVAGCPPDAMGPLGQRWGNPLYRWERMAAEGFAWWTARVKRAMQQADNFRIDHFRGFAACYEIPASCPTAQVGQWVAGPGHALFDAITDALGPLPIVAEDLGLITPDVVELLERTGLPGMKLICFAFGGDGTHGYLPHNYGTHCVVYSGTHDNDTARGWWAAAPESERRFAGTYLACSASDVHWGMIRAAANSVAAMAIYPLQDVLGLGPEHRMNVPGTMGDPNWTWRFSWDLVGTEPGRVLGLITAASGRGPFESLGAQHAGQNH